MIKIGDRIKINKDFLKGATRVDGSQCPTPVLMGMEGVIVGANTSYPYLAVYPKCWAIQLDKLPNETLAFDQSFFGLIGPIAEAKLAIAKFERPAVCSCSLAVIMGQGCVCGHIKRYVPPHKRLMDLEPKEVKK